MYKVSKKHGTITCHKSRESDRDTIFYWLIPSVLSILTVISVKDGLLSISTGYNTSPSSTLYVDWLKNTEMAI